MKIIKRSEAMKMQKRIFPHGIFLKISRFDGGKYKGPGKRLIGREVSDIKTVAAVYPVSKYDQDGPYVALYCLSTEHNFK